MNPQTRHKTLPSLINLNFEVRISGNIQQGQNPPLFDLILSFDTHVVRETKLCRQLSCQRLILIKFKPGKFELSLMNILGWNSISVLCLL